MIDILSKDGCSHLHLTSDGKLTCPTLDSVSLTCTLSYHDLTRHLDATFLRTDLLQFSQALDSMYTQSSLHSQATLWSSAGRVVMTFTAKPLGQIVVNCLLSRGEPADEYIREELAVYKEYGFVDGENVETIHLFGRLLLDLSYLPTLVNEVRQASEWYDAGA